MMGVHDHCLKGKYPPQSRQERMAIIKVCQIVTLISYLILSKISKRFWVTIRMQQITMMVRRARLLCQFDLDFPLSSKLIHPKYWHSFNSSILSNSTLTNRFVAKTKNSMNQNSLRVLSLVLLKMKSSMGVIIFEKTLLWSIFMSSFVFFLLISLMKKTMVSRKCMKIMKA